MKHPVPPFPAQSIRRGAKQLASAGRIGLRAVCTGRRSCRERVAERCARVEHVPAETRACDEPGLEQDLEVVGDGARGAIEETRETRCVDRLADGVEDLASRAPDQLLECRVALLMIPRQR